MKVLVEQIKSNFNGQSDFSFVQLLLFFVTFCTVNAAEIWNFNLKIELAVKNYSLFQLWFPLFCSPSPLLKASVLKRQTD